MRVHMPVPTLRDEEDNALQAPAPTVVRVRRRATGHRDDRDVPRVDFHKGGDVTLHAPAVDTQRNVSLLTVSFGCFIRDVPRPEFLEEPARRGNG